MSAPPVTPPAAVEQLYALWLWLEDRQRDFPTHARHGVGRRLVATVLDALDLLTEASYAARASEKRLEALSRANERLAFARLLLRGTRDLRLLSLDQHAYAAEAIVGVGQSVGAWLKSESAKR